MASNIFCVTSPGSLGCTFLDWSIHYLSGKTKFFNTDDGWSELTTDPAKASNAHGHRRNHPSSLENTLKCIDVLKKETDLVSFYPYPIRANLFCDKFGYNYNELRSEVADLYIKYIKQDFNNILQTCADMHIPFVLVTIADDDIFLFKPRNTGKWTSTEPAGSLKEIIEHELDYYFQDSLKEQHTIWDKRETLALCIRPYSQIGYVNTSHPHLHLDAKDIMFGGLPVFKKVLDYLNLPLDESRVDHWYNVYNNWSSKIHKNMSFCWNIKSICDSIVNDHYYDLTIHDLDLYDEAIIQHTLIFKYGLTIKNLGLEKFPNNTRELHKLLEPNFHPIENIYNQTNL